MRSTVSDGRSNTDDWAWEAATLTSMDGANLFTNPFLGTLFGMTLLSHQIGGFLGAWLGGLAITQLGDYTWMWWADIALAALAALLNLPIREARVVPLAASAAEGR